mmetsp:Transcript_64013/g.208871  ORF Transcript_64013/g.208871 Transcript_64013/m.208871 type:complete len:105 (+) Transcript_64013:40-354(+)
MLLLALLTQRAMYSPRDGKHWGKRKLRHQVPLGRQHAPWWTKWCGTINACGTRNGQTHLRTMAPLRVPGSGRHFSRHFGRQSLRGGGRRCGSVCRMAVAKFSPA